MSVCFNIESKAIIFETPEEAVCFGMLLRESKMEIDPFKVYFSDAIESEMFKHILKDLYDWRWGIYK
jgi:hypothetical protein